MRPALVPDPGQEAHPMPAFRPVVPALAALTLALGLGAAPARGADLPASPPSMPDAAPGAAPDLAPVPLDGPGDVAPFGVTPPEPVRPPQQPLISPEERALFKARLKAARTPEEREAIQAEHADLLRERRDEARALHSLRATDRYRRRGDAGPAEPYPPF
jgi:hypothetical protein